MISATRMDAAKHVRSVLPLLLMVYLPPFILLTIVAIASQVMGVEIERFTRDPAAISYTHPLLGVVSNLGVLCWCGATTCCLLTWRAVAQRPTRRPNPGFFLYAGSLTGVLLLDYLFMVHDRLAPSYLHINEKVFYLLYALLAVIFLWRYRRTIMLHTPVILLVSALACLGLSVGVDMLQPEQQSMHYILEDGFKFLGITGWASYFILTCWRRLAL